MPETLTLDPTDGPEVTNLSPNPSGEVAKKFADGSDFPVTREITGTNGVPAFVGLYRDKHAFDGTSSTEQLGVQVVTFPAPGTYVASLYIWIPSSWDGGAPILDWTSLTGSSGEAGVLAASLALRDQWQRIARKITVDAADLVGSCALEHPTASPPSSAPTGILYSDAFLVEAGETPSDYFDGDTEPETIGSRYEWTGTPHASTSRRVNVRAELEIHDIPNGISVRPEGPDWGDAEIAAYMAEGRVGETPVDYRIPNRKVTIPLQLMGDDFAARRRELQQKVGLFMREGGQLRRTMSDGSVLYLDIVNATLGMGGGTMQALHDVDDAVDLILETIPDWYGPWTHLDPIIETTDAAIITVLEQDGSPAHPDGDMPSRCRLRVWELEGEDRDALIWGWRSRNRDGDIELNVIGSPVALTGANTELENVNFNGQVGAYRAWARVEVETAPVDLFARWQIAAGAFTDNPVWTISDDGFFLADLGAFRIPTPAIGTAGGDVEVWAVGLAGTHVTVHGLWLVPLDEGAGYLRGDSAHVLYAGSIMDLGTDGARLRNAGDDSPVEHVVGDLPRIPPSGLEERDVELFVKASRGDITTTADDGVDDLAVQVSYRSSYLFTAA